MIIYLSNNYIHFSFYLFFVEFPESWWVFAFTLITYTNLSAVAPDKRISAKNPKKLIKG